ncbi:glycosyltransferase [Azotobacter beijerinckii]|uniref:Glycosyltransferase, GT2 family n=1 Tax=Azotobacter beijerinckii TaxID=170623 RepID=A0A1I4AAL5_9GAMM|nr:glycosyltransferase [Azotobacter beijerinckii]SFA92441.1 Glycosyltransferase, GT2 family [Azotobacter beijerinckii]SFK53425.1 Glycosyltransferase, GT2 family [Azotobacter beijerinckii]
MKRIAIIVPTLDEAARLGRTLEAARHAAEHAGLEYELIVPDNGSRDGSQALARRLGARVLDCPGMSIGALRNRGAAASSGDCLAFLDADMEMPPDWLTTWRAVRAEDRAEVLGLVHQAPPQAPWYARAWLQRVAAERDRPTRVDWLPTANLCLERAWFERVGGFDESLRSGEDKDLGLRLGQAGARLLSLPTPTVLNWGFESSWGEWLGKELWRQSSQAQLLRKGRASLRRLRFPLLAAGHWALDALALLGLLLGQPAAALGAFALGWLPAVLLTLRHRYTRQRPLLAVRLTVLHWLRLHVAGIALLMGLVDLNARRPSRG